MPARIPQLPVPPSVSDAAALVDPSLPDEIPPSDPLPLAPWPLPGAEDELDDPTSPGLADWPPPDEAPFDEPPRPEEAPPPVEPSEFVEPMPVPEGLCPHAKSRNANELTITFDPTIETPPSGP
jgi:hypothetical protein